MRVGILTIFKTGNYGAQLQAFATKRIFSEQGCTADIINYCCENIEGKINKNFIKRNGILGTVVTLVEKAFYLPRMSFARRFARDLAGDVILKKEELPSLNDIYDIFVSGSDQLWNPGISGNDKSYLLDFVVDSSKKKSYASSFGVSELPNEIHDDYATRLNDYNMITTRENEGADLIEKLIGKRPDVVLDPTLLLTREKWNELLPSKRLIEKPYTFVYQMAYSPQPARAAKAAKKAMGGKIAFVPFPLMGLCFSKNYLSLNVFEWIAAIRDSQFVLTDSFHGMIFSIIFEKNFYYIVTSKNVENRIARIKTILKELGIEGRVIKNLDKLDFKATIDYKSVNKKLDVKREKSIKALKRLLR